MNAEAHYITPAPCRPVQLFANGLYRVACILAGCKRHGAVRRYADAAEAWESWNRTVTA